ncbi:MAG: PSD1 and planctomycete cytochrome C domain-containing protein [Rubripirellula sp.]|nr:PSD1 and planctomycete cytochrome C domain-containing protein [Rubripirellula sp.]
MFVLIFWFTPLSGLLAKDNFVGTIAPILEQHCLSCHNEQDRKGDFSLQTAKSATADGYIEAGDAAASHLIEVITPENGKAKMPKQADALSFDQIESIRQWVNDGAQWPAGFELKESRVSDFNWWSYQSIVRPPVPPLKNRWVRTPIDAFVLRTLQQQGLTASAEADRRTLIRRVTYDLIGLPPSPQQVENFVTNTDPQAYDRLVERLLASSHYGERWARHWLDVVKYADTCGYDKDKLRPNAWPYRDYVIRSFNEDKPFKRFVQEQIAGDVLFPGDPDGILGLGFIAAGPWDFIGHVEVSESKIDGKVARNLDRDDMVSGALNTFCSVTVQCARCHNHKFDPITQNDYYGLQSIFAAVDRAERPYDLDPKVENRRRDLESKVAKQQQRLDAVNRQIDEAGGTELTSLRKKIESLEAQVGFEKTDEFGYHSAIDQRNDTQKWVEVDLGDPVDVSQIVLHASHDEFGGIGAGFGFPVRFQVSAIDESNETVVVYDHLEGDFENPGLEPLVINVAGQSVRRVRVTVSKLSPRSNDFIFALGELRVLDAEGTNRAKGQPVASHDSIEAPTRWARLNLTDGQWPHYRDPKAAAALRPAKLEMEKLKAKIETPERLSERESATKQLASARSELASLPKGKMVYAAATHFGPQGNFHPTEGKLRPVHVLHRGEILQPRGLATPGMLPLGEDRQWQIDENSNESERRAALANWLTDERHPLVWRSIVNRIWHYHFGRGIVATPNDFGRMGAIPTHPELLDWLAVEFRDGGDWLESQSLKSLHRLIVTSSVYRQSSSSSTSLATNAAIDGSNQYLWRMSRRRLEAEEIRDSILQVSGTMNPKMGGPGYYLFQLERTAHSPHYEYHKFDPNDAASHRRSIYRFIVRSQPDPWMTTLDCADSSQSTPKRNETLTSLQALSLLNSRFSLVMAEKFVTRVEKQAAGLEEQVRLAASLVMQREPSQQESQMLITYARQHGLNNLCRFLFNLSEFVYLD